MRTWGDPDGSKKKRDTLCNSFIFSPYCPTILSFVLISPVFLLSLQCIKKCCIYCIYFHAYTGIWSHDLVLLYVLQKYLVAIPYLFATIHPNTPNIPLSLQCLFLCVKDFEYSWSSVSALWFFLVPDSRALVMTTLNIYVVWLWMVWKGKSDSLTTNTHITHTTLRHRHTYSPLEGCHYECVLPCKCTFQLCHYDYMIWTHMGNITETEHITKITTEEKHFYSC